MADAQATDPDDAYAEVARLGFNERELCERHGIGPEDYRNGATYRRVAEKTGMLFELELPAGAVLWLSDRRRYVLQAAVKVLTDDPVTVLESARAGADWSPAIPMRLVEKPVSGPYRVALAYVPRE